jgi:hypothetical protein
MIPHHKTGLNAILKKIAYTEVDYTATKATETVEKWVSLDPASGEAGEITIKLALSTNYTGTDRKATIHIICGGTTITVIIEQKGETENGEVPDEDSPADGVRKISEIITSTDGEPNQPDNPNTSGVQTFMHALPKPELEVRLVKRSEFNWNECTKVDGNEEFKYEQILVLKNYEDYPKDENWTVTVTRNGVTNPYTFSRQNGKKYIRIAWSIGVTKTFTALATPAAGSTSYLRSAEYKVETYVPSQWRDVNKEDAKKNEDGLPAGTLTKAENATEYVTCTGQSAENFTATVTFGFTPTLADPTHGSPTYRVMEELYPTLLGLTQLARQYDIGINIDAEEADRLEISLDLLEKLCFDPSLADWNGIGFVIQAYQKRCPYVIDYVIDLAKRSRHRLMTRLW